MKKLFVLSLALAYNLASASDASDGKKRGREDAAETDTPESKQARIEPRGVKREREGTDETSNTKHPAIKRVMTIERYGDEVAIVFEKTIIVTPWENLQNRIGLLRNMLEDHDLTQGPIYLPIPQYNTTIAPCTLANITQFFKQVLGYVPLGGIKNLLNFMEHASFWNVDSPACFDNPNFPMDEYLQALQELAKAYHFDFYGAIRFLPPRCIQLLQSYRAHRFPLHRAAAGADVEAIQTLAAMGFPIDTINQHGFTALHIAAGTGYSTQFATTATAALAAVQALITAGANVNALDHNGMTPLYRTLLLYPCTRRFGLEIVQALIDAGATIERTALGIRALEQAEVERLFPVTAMFGNVQPTSRLQRTLTH